FLVQFLGGPAEATQKRHWLSLRESHHRFVFGERERTAWLALMSEALRDAEIPEGARNSLQAFFERSSAYIVRSESSAPPVDSEVAGRWRTQLGLEDAVAAIRSGDTARTLALADPACGPERFAALLAEMIGAGDPALLAFVRPRVSEEPSLAGVRFAGRTL